MLIKGYSLQEETVFETGKFTILWNWFERSGCHNNCNPGKIKQIATRIHIDEEKQAHLAEVLNERRNWFVSLKQNTSEILYILIMPEPPKKKTWM